MQSNHFRTLTIQAPTKKFWKIVVITFGIILVLLTAFHFWFKAYAKGMIEDMVDSNSKGKLKLQIGQLHFNYLTRKIQLDKAVFYNTDTLTGSTAYRFSVEKIDLRAKAFLPIIFKKKILIDSLKLLRPHIQVTRLREIEKPDKKEKKDVSIPEEMGKVYTSIQDALAVLKVKKFQIEYGTFTLINKIIPNQLPMTVSNLYFQIDNLEVDSTHADSKDKILFSDNVIFRSDNQDILFPDGRHRLSFSHFRINLQKKLVEFDSCTIAATRTDSASASFSVFFDALSLTNIDFDTLYKSEVIKADSVYCVNPTFNLVVDASKKKETNTNKAPPKLENIIQQLTGNLLLEHVVVTNADFNIKTIKNGIPNTFTFTKNNFEMQGLSIDQQAIKPIKVNSFAMAIRNYENFIKDSTYSIQFDSVIIKDAQITLSNFIFNKLENGRILNSFSIPQFNLLGLSWDELVFDQRLKAEQAIMFNPHISYTVSPSKKKGKQKDIFASLASVNEVMDLKSLDIREGVIDIRLKNNVRVQLENANVSVQSNSLLTSTKMSGIQSALKDLNFKKGRVQAGDLLIELDDIRYAGPNDKFEAGLMHVKSTKKRMDVSLYNVKADKMLFNEKSGSILANDLQWERANIKVNSQGSGKKEGNAVIELRNVTGNNTTLTAVTGATAISTKLGNISFNELISRPGSKLKLDGLVMNGQQLKVKSKELDLTVASYNINDNASSEFRQVRYQNKTAKAEADLSIPSFSFIPHVQSLLNGSMSFDAINLVRPVIRYSIFAPDTTVNEKKKGLPSLTINGLRLTQPNINFSQVKDSGSVSIVWQGEKNSSSFLQAGSISTGDGNYRLNDLHFFLTNFLFTSEKGKTFDLGKGIITAQVKTVDIGQDEAGLPEWRGNLGLLTMKDFRMDSIGTSGASLVINSGSVENLDIRSSTILDFRELAATNRNFRLKNFTGQFRDADKQLHWHNAGFSRYNNILSADSFFIAPVLEKDSFIARQQFQKDYITVRTGAIQAGPVDIDGYIKDNKLDIGTVEIDRFFFTDYKDKELPFNAGTTKPLPVALLKRISLPISIDTFDLTRATVHYTERMPGAKEAGFIPITRMNVRVLNAKNYDFIPGDSLYVKASGYLLDTAWIQLMVTESYMDSLGGFIMIANAKPADLTFLNPVLLPLGSARIESGFMDTLHMKATGNDILAWGEMQMFYHDMKISVFKKGEDKKRKFLSGIANLLIKNNNDSRTAAVFFLRQHDRSAINYLIKIVVNGITSSVGVKNNKRKIRRYKDVIERKK